MSIIINAGGGGISSGEYVWRKYNTKDLPSGHKPLEYIESSGTQYIDTGFIPNQDTRVVVDFEFIDFTEDYGGVFGGRNGNTNAFAFYYGKSTIYDQYGSVNNPPQL